VARSVRVLHTGDVHLGRKAGLGHATRNHHRLIGEAFSKTAKLAAEQADLLLIAGDLFDDKALFGTFVEHAVKTLQEALDASQNLRVIVVAGNHDPPSIYHRPEWRVLEERVFIVTEPTLLELDDLELAVLALPWQPAKSLSWDGWPSGARVIAAAHACYPPPPAAHSQPDNCVLTTEEVQRWPVSYVALAHYHKPSTHRVGETHLAYSGAPEVIDLDHTGQGQALLVTLNEKGAVSIKALATGQLKGLGIQEWQWDALPPPQRATLRSRLSQLADPLALLRVRLCGLRRQALSKELEEIREELSNSFFYLDIRDETVVAPDVEELGEGDDFTVLGRFVRIAKEQLDNAKARLERAQRENNAEEEAATREEIAVLQEALLLGTHLLTEGGNGS
jgi:DNA repair exonuclease SbcCD nuclease subunit